VRPIPWVVHKESPSLPVVARGPSDGTQAHVAICGRLAHLGKHAGGAFVQLLRYVGEGYGVGLKDV
jgi:hypothetical protein